MFVTPSSQKTAPRVVTKTSQFSVTKQTKLVVVVVLKMSERSSKDLDVQILHNTMWSHASELESGVQDANAQFAKYLLICQLSLSITKYIGL